MMNGWSRLVRVTAPASPVISLAEAKKHLRVLHDDDDTEIEAFVAAATAMIEGPNGIGIALSSQTWRLSLDHFPCEIIVPLGPVISIDGISYTKEDGTSGTTDRWRVDMDSQPCRIWPPYDGAWPVSRCEPGAVKVTFTAGFTTIPADLKAAILLLVGHLYENREAVADKAMAELPMAVSTILDRYRVGRVA
jgi:uncharacterized phiE125 gp8 family phage protein